LRCPGEDSARLQRISAHHHNDTVYVGRQARKVRSDRRTFYGHSVLDRMVVEDQVMIAPDLAIRTEQQRGHVR
jgi:hypothetical protein